MTTSLTGPAMDLAALHPKQSARSLLARVTVPEVTYTQPIGYSPVKETAMNAPRDTVTMNKPLEPWPQAVAFHRTLAFHIHNATRAAYHSRNLDSNYGLCDDQEQAARFDLSEAP